MMTPRCPTVFIRGLIHSPKRSSKAISLRKRSILQPSEACLILCSGGCLILSYVGHQSFQGSSKATACCYKGPRSCVRARRFFLGLVPRGQCRLCSGVPRGNWRLGSILLPSADCLILPSAGCLILSSVGHRSYQGSSKATACCYKGPRSRVRSRRFFLGLVPRCNGLLSVLQGQ
jgi:hypothetical protein